MCCLAGACMGWLSRGRTNHCLSPVWARVAPGKAAPCPYFLVERTESQSIAASMTPDTTKVRWITTNQ
jgi:hypothetical protein